MTVQDRFHNWSSSPRVPDPGSCSPLLTNLRHWLLNRWGGQNLGCYSRRPIVGGTALSAHASGAALDWRYESPGMGRAAMLETAMPLLLNESRELGVQAIHDYSGRRIWRPPGTNGRPSTPSPECGWRPNSGSQMHPANLWLHIEVLDTMWANTTPIDTLLAGTTPTPPPTPPPSGGGTYTVVAGDSWWSISQRYGITVDQLVAMNPPATSATVIHPGQVLNVPQVDPDPPPPIDGSKMTTPPADPVLRRGTVHSNVPWLQAVLSSMPRLPADGGGPIFNPAWIGVDRIGSGAQQNQLFGDATHNALTYWQGANGLNADGVYGSATASRMAQVRGR